MEKERQKLINLHNPEIKVPSPEVIDFGEIAVQHNDDEAALYIKKNNEEMAKFVDETAVDSKVSELKETVKDKIAQLKERLKKEIDSLTNQIEAETERATKEESRLETLLKKLRDEVKQNKVSSKDNTILVTESSDGTNIEVNLDILSGITQDISGLEQSLKDEIERAMGAEEDLANVDKELAGKIQKLIDEALKGIVDGAESGVKVEVDKLDFNKLIVNGGTF